MHESISKLSKNNPSQCHSPVNPSLSSGGFIFLFHLLHWFLPFFCFLFLLLLHSFLVGLLILLKLFLFLYNLGHIIIDFFLDKLDRFAVLFTTYFDNDIFFLFGIRDAKFNRSKGGSGEYFRGHSVDEKFRIDIVFPEVHEIIRGDDLFIHKTGENCCIGESHLEARNGSDIPEYGPAHRIWHLFDKLVCHDEIEFVFSCLG